MTLWWYEKGIKNGNWTWLLVNCAPFHISLPYNIPNITSYYYSCPKSLKEVVLTPCFEKNQQKKYCIYFQHNFFWNKKFALTIDLANNPWLQTWQKHNINVFYECISFNWTLNNPFSQGTRRRQFFFNNMKITWIEIFLGFGSWSKLSKQHKKKWKS